VSQINLCLQNHCKAEILQRIEDSVVDLSAAEKTLIDPVCACPLPSRFFPPARMIEIEECGLATHEKIDAKKRRWIITESGVQR